VFILTGQKQILGPTQRFRGGTGSSDWKSTREDPLVLILEGVLRVFCTLGLSFALMYGCTDVSDVCTDARIYEYTKVRIHGNTGVQMYRMYWIYRIIWRTDVYYTGVRIYGCVGSIASIGYIGCTDALKYEPVYRMCWCVRMYRTHRMYGCISQMHGCQDGQMYGCMYLRIYGCMGGMHMRGCGMYGAEYHGCMNVLGVYDIRIYGCTDVSVVRMCRMYRCRDVRIVGRVSCIGCTDVHTEVRIFGCTDVYTEVRVCWCVRMYRNYWMYSCTSQMNGAAPYKLDIMRLRRCRMPRRRYIGCMGSIGCNGSNGCTYGNTDIACTDVWKYKRIGFVESTDIRLYRMYGCIRRTDTSFIRKYGYKDVRMHGCMYGSMDIRIHRMYRINGCTGCIPYPWALLMLMLLTVRLLDC